MNEYIHGVFNNTINLLLKWGPPRGAWNHAFTQVFRTNHAQKLLEIHVHAKFTQSRWMPDWFFTQSRNYFHPIHVFTLWNMSNHAITLSPWGPPSMLGSNHENFLFWAFLDKHILSIFWGWINEKLQHIRASDWKTLCL